MYLYLKRNYLKLERVKEICNRPDSVPYLARIIEEDIYWEIGGPGDAWSSIHALHLLGGIKTTEALNVLIATLSDYGEDIGDWLLGSMPSILANFGPSAIEPLKVVVLDVGLDVFVRGAASKALVVIAYNHSECQEPIIKLFRQIIRDADVRDVEDSDKKCCLKKSLYKRTDTMILRTGNK